MEKRDPNGRFRKGACPNPNGRPRKDRSVSAAILTAADAKVTATENGKRRKIRKIDATAAQIANKGAAGDIRAGKLLLDLAARSEADRQSVAPADTPLTADDQQIVEWFLAEYRQFLTENPT